MKRFQVENCVQNARQYAGEEPYEHISYNIVDGDVEAENEKEAIENAVMEQEKDDSAVTNIVAYDIKFMMNGQEVQPSSPVQVSVDSPQIVSDQDTSVYHVDENNSVEDMDGSVDADGNILFDARFFRNYPLLLLYPMYLNFASSNCLPHLPYIVRFIIFNLLLVPSTNPLL